MAQKITYEDKVALNINPTIPDINKCNATDMNEIKETINNNADELDTKTQIFQGDTPPEDPEDGALWVDTDDEGIIVEVDQEVSTSSKNAVSNKAITEYVNGTVLFEGNLASEITLNDSLANYKYIEIFGYATDSVSSSGKKIYTKIENPNNSLFYLNGFDIEESSKIFYLKTATCLCENKKITFETNYQWYKQGDGTTGGGSTGNYIRITKVIGYKEV